MVLWDQLSTSFGALESSVNFEMSSLPAWAQACSTRSFLTAAEPPSGLYQNMTLWVLLKGGSLKAVDGLI